MGAPVAGKANRVKLVSAEACCANSALAPTPRPVDNARFVSPRLLDFAAGDQEEPGSRKALGELDGDLKALEFATGRDDPIHLLFWAESGRREALL